MSYFMFCSICCFNSSWLASPVSWPKEGHWLCFAAYQPKSCWATQLLIVTNQLSWSDGSWRHSPQWVGAVMQLLSWVWEDPVLELVKFLIWVSKSGRCASHQSTWSECTLALFLQMRKASGWDYYLGTMGMNSICQYPCDGCYKLPWPFITAGFPVVQSCIFPCNSCGIRSETPTKQPHFGGGIRLSPLDSLFPLEETAKWRPLWVVSCSPGGGASWSTYNHSSYPSNACILVSQLWGQGGGFSLTSYVLGFSKQSFILEQLLVVLLMNGEKVKNDICCHLDDITSWPNLFQGQHNPDTRTWKKFIRKRNHK